MCVVASRVGRVRFSGTVMAAPPRRRSLRPHQALNRAFNLVSEADDPLLYGLLCSMQASTLLLEETAPLAERVMWFERARQRKSMCV